MPPKRKGTESAGKAKTPKAKHTSTEPEEPALPNLQLHPSQEALAARVLAATEDENTTGIIITSPPGLGKTRVAGTVMHAMGDYQLAVLSARIPSLHGSMARRFAPPIKTH